jgi:Tfp pilus assembly protein PilF
MTMKQQRRIPWLLAATLTVPALASAMEGRLIGKIVDPTGKPISGVSVTATCPEDAEFRQVTTTNDKGLFKVDFSRLNTLYRYEFEKAGFVTLRMEQKWTVEGTERHEFRMSPAETAATDGRPPVSTSNAAIVAFNGGAVAFKAKDYATARAKFEEALSYDPYMRLAWAALAQVHLDQKRYREAADAADKAIALGSTDESVLRLRWEAYRNLGDAAQAARARADVEKFGRLAEEAKRIHNEGVALAKSGDDAGAFAKFQEAVTIDPGLEPALLGLATTGLKIDRAAEAFTAAETVLKTHPEHAEALKLRYNAALKLGDDAKLGAALLGLAAIDAATARTGLFALATKAFQSDDTAGAKERFQHVLEIDPNHAPSHYYLGLILMREGANQDAKSHLKRFLELAPGDPDAATAREALTHLR